MKKLLRNLTLLGAAAGAAYAARGYLAKPSGAEADAVQISFEDGTSESLAPAEAEEFTDIARGVLQASGR